MIGFKALIHIATLAAGMALASQAGAVKLNLDMPLCNDFSLAGVAPNQTLVCNTGSVPSCVVAPQPVTAGVGTNVTLTATCTNSPASWTWAGCTTPSNNTCVVTSASATTINGTVLATNGQGAGGTTNWAVTFTAGAPPAPSGCSIATTTANLPNAGGTAVINLSCTGQAATSWIVRRNGVQVANPSGNQVSVNDNVPAGGVNATNYTYTAVPDNGGTPGTTTPASVLVTVAGSGGGGGGNCGMTTKDLGGIAFDSSKIDFDLGDGTKEVAVAYFTATAANLGKTTELQFYEYIGGPIERTVWVSKTRCEMTDAVRLVKADSAPSIGFSVNGPPRFTPQVNMAVGETWYVMIRNLRYTTNFPNGKNSCIELPCATRMSGTYW